MIDKILKKFNLKYEELNKAEIDTLNLQLEALQKNQLSVLKVREYIISMKSAVEQELTKADLGTKQDMFLKARLKNYMLLEAFLTSPNRARKAIEESLSNIKKT